jgi:predicted lipoprotein with Yx(FWY)xxD motif
MMRSGTIAGLVLVGAAALAACSSGAATNNTSNAALPAATKMSTTTAIDVGNTSLGKVLVDANGRTLYGFARDTNGTPTCNGTCAQVWPPVIVSPGWTASPAAQGANLHTVKRDDGQLQLAAGKWPLYTFASDQARGDVTGQGVENFFVVQPDAKLHKNVTTSSTVASTAASSSGSGY